MTIISPYQRQLVFTRSFLDNAKRPRQSRKSLLARFLGFWKQEMVERDWPVHGILAVGAVMMAVVLGLGIQAVLISFEKNSLAAELKQSRLEREQLELRSAELLSPQALRIYASMLQLVQPGSIKYLSVSASVAAQHAAASGLAP